MYSIRRIVMTTTLFSVLSACAVEWRGARGDLARPSGQTEVQKNSTALPRNLELVGPTGFEPVTFCTPSKRATRLRYGPSQECASSAKNLPFEVARSIPKRGSPCQRGPACSSSSSVAASSQLAV